MDQDLSLRVSKDESLSWKDNPVTQAYFYSINELVKEKMLDLAGGIAMSGRAEETAQQYARVCGYIEALKAVLNIEIEEE